MRRLLRRSAVAATVLATSALATACGIPLSNGAKPLPRSQVPPPLLVNPGPSTTTTTQPDTPDTKPIAVYFLNAAESRLVRTVAEEPAPTTANEALGLLTYGPTAAESKHGLQSALPSGARATMIKLDKFRGVATVAVDESTAALFGSPLSEAEAQIVFTVTAGFGVHGVLFTYPGGPLEAFLPDGRYVSRPVTRADFAQLAPPVPTTTSIPGSIHT